MQIINDFQVLQGYGCLLWPPPLFNSFETSFRATLQINDFMMMLLSFWVDGPKHLELHVIHIIQIFHKERKYFFISFRASLHYNMFKLFLLRLEGCKEFLDSGCSGKYLEGKPPSLRILIIVLKNIERLWAKFPPLFDRLKHPLDFREQASKLLNKGGLACPNIALDRDVGIHQIYNLIKAIINLWQKAFACNSQFSGSILEKSPTSKLLAISQIDFFLNSIQVYIRQTHIFQQSQRKQCMAQRKLTQVGIKYLEQTNLYRTFSHQQRLEFIRRKFKEPRSQQLFLRKFPEYPIKQIWQKNGYELQTYFWEPENQLPKAVFVNFNALNAHIGLSGDMAKYYAKAGYVFTGYDFPNFGRSSGNQRGHMQSFQEIMEMSEDFVEQVYRKYAGVPIFIGGVSMGGLISFQLGLKIPEKIKGCIFINPALEDNPQNIPNLKTFIKKFGHLYPKLQLTKPLRSNSTKYSLDQYKKYDPYLYTGRFWTSTSMYILKAMQKAPLKFSQFKLPYLCIQGGTDKVINPFVLYDLQDKSNSLDKESIFIQKFWHGLWFDDHLHEVIQLTKNWIDQRV